MTTSSLARQPAPIQARRYFLLPLPLGTTGNLSSNFTRLSTERADTSSSPARNSSDLLQMRPALARSPRNTLSLACSLLGMENESRTTFSRFSLPFSSGLAMTFLSAGLAVPTSAVFFLAAPLLAGIFPALSGTVDADAPARLPAGALAESDEAVAVDDAGAAAAAPAAAGTAAFRTTDFAAAARARAGLSIVALLAAELAAAGLRAALEFGAGDFGAGDLAVSAPPFPLSAAAALLDEAFVRALVVLLLAIKILHLSMGPAPGTRKMADAAGPSSKNPRETTKSTIRGRSRFSRCERRPEAAFDKQHIAHRVITHENNKAFHRKTNQAG